MPAERERLSVRKKLVEMERSVKGERLGKSETLIETQRGETQVN